MPANPARAHANLRDLAGHDAASQRFVWKGSAASIPVRFERPDASSDCGSAADCRTAYPAPAADIRRRLADLLRGGCR